MFLRLEYDKIIDSDFIENRSPLNGDIWIAEEIIKVYEQKKLNVALNLALAFKFMSTKFGWEIEECVNNTKHYVPDYAKYADDVNKYLMLM